MSKIFISIYDWFEKHRVAFFAILISFVVVLAIMASRVSFGENITSFFNNSSDEKNATFENLAVKDKIVVLISGTDPDSIISSAEIFEQEIETLKEEYNIVTTVELEGGLATMCNLSDYIEEKGIEKGLSALVNSLKYYFCYCLPSSYSDSAIITPSPEKRVCRRKSFFLTKKV
jgi:predicted RND superfamily exporter protein